MFSEKVLDRFWRQVRKNKGGCWLWTGKPGNGGYGRFTLKRNGRYKPYLAHRLSMSIYLGRWINIGICVLHNCPGGDNPACVNPAHLWLGSYADNNRDTIRKGRFKHHGGFIGTKHPMHKLSEKDIRNIRLRLQKGEPGQRIAKSLGVHHSTIYSIRDGESWSHVT